MTDTAKLIAQIKAEPSGLVWKEDALALADALEAAQKELDTLRKELAWAVEIQEARDRGVTL